MKIYNQTPNNPEFGKFYLNSDDLEYSMVSILTEDLAREIDKAIVEELLKKK